MLCQWQDGATRWDGKASTFGDMAIPCGKAAHSPRAQPNAQPIGQERERLCPVSAPVQPRLRRRQRFRNRNVEADQIIAKAGIKRIGQGFNPFPQ